MTKRTDENHPSGSSSSVIASFSDALQQQCLPGIVDSTVPILAVQHDRIVHDRTGVLYRVADRHFILTAAHNLLGIVDNAIPLYVSLNIDGVHPISLCDSEFLATEADKQDIAAITLTDDVARQVAAHNRFVSHNEVVLEDDGHGRFYIAVGYPMAWSAKKLTESFLYSDPLIYLCPAYTDSVDPDSTYLPDVHVLLSFDRNAYELNSAQSEPLPKPSGISGCGIWRVAYKSPEGIKTACKATVSLVAIQHCWNGQKNYLMGTRMGWVLQRILDAYRELNRPMQLIYSRK